MKNNKKEKKPIKLIKTLLITLLIIILLIVITFIAVIIFIAARYNNSSYEYRPPVEREESYVMPDYPNILFESESSETPAETSAPPVVGEETESKESSAVNSETVFQPPLTEETTVEETTDNELVTQPIVILPLPPEDSTESKAPMETLPPVITVPESTVPSYVVPENPNASFENSPNTVSVYGNVPIYRVNQKDPNIVNILLLGTDTRDVVSDRGRSDTMIIISYNKQTGSIKLTSLLRDSLLPISGHDWNRINMAYFFDGVGLAINTINEVFDLDIQLFAVIDINGTRNLIDRIGGVNVTLTQEEVDLYNCWGGSYTAGVNYMEGELLFRHMRNRSIGSDFERTRRQRDVITALINKVITEKSIKEIYDLADYAMGLVKTNIPLTTLTSLTASVASNLSILSISSQNVPYSDAFRYATYNGMSILSFDIPSASKRINDFIYN